MDFDKMFAKAIKVLDIPDLSLEDVSNDDTFLLVGSNKDNVHHIYKVQIQDLNNWVDMTPVKDRVTSCNLAKDDSDILFPKEDGGNEQYNIFLTNFNSNKPELYLEFNDTRISTIKRTKDKKFIFIDGATKENIHLWKYNVNSKTLKEVYKTKMWGGIGRLHPEKPLVTWSELKHFGSTDEVTKIINYENFEITKTIDLGKGAITEARSWSPDGSKCLMYVNLSETPSIGIYELESGKMSYSKAHDLKLGVEFPAFEWMSNDEIIFSAQLNGETKLYREVIGNQPVEIPFPRGFINNIIQGNKNKNKYYICWSSISHSTQIIELDVETNKQKTLIDSNPFRKELNFAGYSFVKYPTFDDKWGIPAYEVEPAHNELPNAPIIVLIHGGPTWEFSNSWETMAVVIHLYSQAGFRVFCPNIRGSTGYGREFQDVNIGDIGGDDLKDVLYAQKYLAEKYPESTIFLTGASYGGFMTFLLMTKHPGIFKAGAPIVGITDYFEMYRLGDQVFKGFTEHFLKGKPDDNKELYADRSAINFVHQLQEPLCIIHRANDYRCPVEPIYTFTGKAHALGKEIEIYVQQDAGHGAQKIEDLKKQYGRVVKFFYEQLAK